MGTFRGVDVKFRAAAFSRRRASIAVGGWPFPCRGFPRPAPMRSSFRRSLSLRLTPPIRRPSGSARYPRPTSDRSRPWSWVPLLEFLKDRPFTDIPVRVLSRLPEVRVCHTRTCSALVVLPDFDGFLRTRLCRSIAPRNRSWGSPGFLPKGRLAPTPRYSSECSSPLRSSSRFQRWPVTRLPASSPLSCGTEVPRSSASRPCSGLASRTGRVATASASSFHGVPSTQAFTEASSLLGMASFRMILRDILADESFGHAPGCSSPAVSRGPGGTRDPPSRYETGGFTLPHSGRCARRGHLPIHDLAGMDRGARDGNRISHGPCGQARTTRTDSCRPKSA